MMMGNVFGSVFVLWCVFQVDGDGRATRRSKPQAMQEAKVSCHDELTRACREDHAEGDAGEADYFGSSCYSERDARTVWWTCDVSCRAWCQSVDD